MVQPMQAEAVLNREFLEIRAKILELAASFDRIDRGGSLLEDPRVDKIRQAIGLLDFEGSDRAEKVQFIFSREYADQWKQQFGLDK
jgi:hypothetical protein